MAKAQCLNILYHYGLAAVAPYCQLGYFEHAGNFGQLSIIDSYKYLLNNLPIPNQV